MLEIFRSEQRKLKFLIEVFEEEFEEKDDI